MSLLSPPPDPSVSSPEEPVETIVAALRHSVRQRQAELAALGGASEASKLALLELRSAEYVQEPVAVSPRPLIGPLLVFVKKAGFHLFFKWWARGVLQQQNRFNQAAARLLEQQAEGQRRLEDDLRELRRAMNDERRGRQDPPREA